MILLKFFGIEGIGFFGNNRNFGRVGLCVFLIAHQEEKAAFDFIEGLFRFIGCFFEFVVVCKEVGHFGRNCSPIIWVQ